METCRMGGQAWESIQSKRTGTGQAEIVRFFSAYWLFNLSLILKRRQVLIVFFAYKLLTENTKIALKYGI